MGILRDMPRLFQSSILLKVCAPVPNHVCVLQFFAKVFEFLRNLGLLGKPSSNARIRERASFQLGWYTLVFLITDRVPNNHPGHQISGSSGVMALLII